MASFEESDIRESQPNRHEAGPSVPRVALNPFLNAVPLTLFLPKFFTEAVYENVFPGDMQSKLLARTTDLGLTAVYDLLQLPGGKILGDACIACDGPVLSVLLMSRKPLEKIETLAVDEKSHSSSALAELILRAVYDVSPAISRLPLEVDHQTRSEDAVLLIGDRALAHRVREKKWPFELDLGDFWNRWTGLPFVFAAWISPADFDWKSLGMVDAIHRARDRGIEQLETIVRTHPVSVPLPVPLAREYLSQRLIYKLGEPERRGMQRFFELVAEYDLAPRKVSFDYVD